MTASRIPATTIRRGDTVRLPSGTIARVQRVHVTAGITTVTFPHPFDGTRHLLPGVTVEVVR